MFILLMFLHFIGDFVLQNDWMALNKSKSPLALFVHSFIYSIVFIPFGLWCWYLLLITHYSIDAITSRITSYLWKKEKRHWFFVCIGFDQFSHLTILYLLFQYL